MADPNKFRKFVVVFLQRVAVVEVLRSYGILCRNGRGRFDQDIDNDNCILHAEQKNIRFEFGRKESARRVKVSSK